MITLLLIIIQMILAFFIVSTIYLLIVYYLKTFLGSGKITASASNEKKDHHLAIVFNDYVKEEDLLSKIQFLNSQGYRNFSAYFFIDEPYVTINNLKNIRIIRPLQKRFGRFGLLNLSKNYFEDTHDAVLVLDPKSELNPGYLQEMNNYLCQGYRVIQGQISVSEQSSEKGAYQRLSRRFYNLIDRKIHQANRLSSALWNQGFAIEARLFEKLNFDSYTNSDKALQAELITRSEKIAFASEAQITEPAFSNDELFAQKKNWYQQYFFNYHLGFNLLLEGIKNPNLEKILFGFNFMRPPLFIMLMASVCLASIDLIWMPKVAFFLWLAIFGTATSTLLLAIPQNPFQYLVSLATSVRALFSGRSRQKTGKAKNNGTGYEPAGKTSLIM